jgi:hypothetical protein
MSNRRIGPIVVLLAITPSCSGDPTEASLDEGFADPQDDASTSDSQDEPVDAEDAGTGGTTYDWPDVASLDESTGVGSDTARIRFVHAAAGAPDVDVYLAGDARPLAVDLAYGSASAYLEVSAGPHDLEVRTAGSSIDDPPIHVGAIDLDIDATVTAIAAGELDSPADEFRILPFVEAFEDPGASRAAVRFVNAAPGAPAIGVDVHNDGSAPEVPGVAPFAASGLAGVAMPADAEVQLGIVGSGDLLTAFTMPMLAEGAGVFAIATGRLDALPRESTGFALLVVGPDGVVGEVRQNPIVYALHASPDSGRFDICIADDARAVAQGFGELVRMQLTPGAHELEYYPPSSACAGDPVNVEPSGMLAAGQQYLLVSAGEIVPEEGNAAFQLSTFTEAFPIDGGDDAELAVIHAGSAPSVDFGILDEGDQITLDMLLVSDLEWAEQSEVLVLPADDYWCGFLPATTPLPAAPYGIVAAPMTQGMRAWMVAAGDVSPQGYDQVATVFTVVTSTSPWTVVPL